MKKFRIGASFFVLFVVCVLTKNIVLLVNYVLALLLHEFAHVFVAGLKGYKLKEMKLGVCGVVVKLDEQVEDQDAFLINLAGPAINLFLSLCCVALFWIVPTSYNILKTFCFANLMLATFNLIPVYPLDGGKIFKNLLKNDKKHKKINKILKILTYLIFFSLFIVSFKYKVNVFYLIMGVYFLTLKEDQYPTFSIFKYSKKRQIEKVVIIKISSNNTLFELVKMLNSKYYTLFYCADLNNHYIDEDKLIELSTKHSLTTTLKELRI